MRTHLLTAQRTIDSINNIPGEFFVGYVADNGALIQRAGRDPELTADLYDALRDHDVRKTEQAQR